MRLERFRDLIRFLRFNDRQRQDKTDRIAPIRFVLNRFVQKLPRHFTPSENVTADEQLIPFRRRCSFIQYMPNKPIMYGLKFWVLCDVESRYVVALDLYTRKVGNLVQRNLAANAVMRLVDQLPADVKHGRNVTYDRYLSDLNLSKALLERKMFSLGVVDHKRSLVPREFKLVRKYSHSSWFLFLWADCDSFLSSEREETSGYNLINSA